MVNNAKNFLKPVPLPMEQVGGLWGPTNHGEDKGYTD